MKKLSKPVTFKFREKASVFLTELYPAPDVDTRAGILSAIRKRDNDATHHCSAWRQGIPVVASGSDDDGEPSGTAGSPMLMVLEGEALTDILAVSVRWYGGTKLGTGGLVRAYTEGVQGAIAEGVRLGLFEEIKALIEGSIEVPQEMAHLPFAVLKGYKNVEILGQDFSDNISTLFFLLPPEDCTSLELAWSERSRGGVIGWKL